MNSFDFLKRQICFVGLKEINLFSTTRWHDMLLFFSPPDTLKRNPSFPLNAHKHILHSWQTSVIFTAVKFDLDYLFIEYLPTKLNSFLSIFFHHMVSASCIRVCLSTLHGRRTQVWFRLLLMLSFITTELLV